MSFSFQKMHANGDDFVIADLRGQDTRIGSDLARRLGDRNRGIGFNQLAVMSDCGDTAARLAFWNADGTALDACGSATRGVAWKLMQETGEAIVKVKTNRGILACAMAGDGFVSVEMGPPLLLWQEIPLARAADTLHLPLPGDPAGCSMGNPHCTFFVADAEAVLVDRRGPNTETDALFPLKTNVHFVHAVHRGRIRLRIWERGGGIPLGSGSCSCGAVVNGIRRGLLDNRVDVDCDGGTVTVAWDGKGSVFLTGPVEPVFEGVWSGGI